MPDVIFRTLYCHSGQDGCKCNENIYQINWYKSEENVKPDDISPPDALGSPWAMVIIALYTHITIPAMICSFFYSEIAFSAQSFCSHILSVHWVLFFLSIIEVPLKDNSWITGCNC